MKIISLYQPYATLCMMGLKTNETRGWNTKYRGVLGIHATANTPKWCRDLMKKWPFSEALAGVEMPTGKILGSLLLVDTTPTEKWVKDKLDYFKKRQDAGLEWTEEFERFQKELMFGDYSENRFAWTFIYPETFFEPIPARGSQGFWHYDLPGR